MKLYFVICFSELINEDVKISYRVLEYVNEDVDGFDVGLLAHDVFRCVDLLVLTFCSKVFGKVRSIFEMLLSCREIQVGRTTPPHKLFVFEISNIIVTFLFPKTTKQTKTRGEK